MVVRRFAFAVAASVGVGTLGAAAANAQTPQARFVTVDQGGDELRADGALAARLGGKLLGTPEQLSYDGVITALLDDARRDNKPLARAGGIVARVTPYAFLVAELRGAKVELLAACRSRSTGRTVTNAFMVVPQSSFTGPAPPTLDQVLEHLKSLSERDRPARFIYHNKYSTSSYFLPSLLFRARRIFGLNDRGANPAGVTTIAVERNESPSSADLIRAVATQAGGRETIASVWSGSRSGFDPGGRDYAEYGTKVQFVPLPDPLPCDLLVATRKVESATKDAIIARLREPQPRGETPGSDVDAWVPWTNLEAGDARRALSDLRRQAGTSTLPVVVDVQPYQRSPVDGDLLDAARLAIRRAGTELVDRSQNDDYYKKSDIRWELERIHDGAVRLTVRYENFRLDNAEVTQQFDVSFQAPADLTRRLVSLVHSRLHRIRPVWLYNDSAPTVLRDVDFDVARRVPFQEIQWNEPQRNDYRLEGESRVATVEKDETFEIQLAKDEFPRRPDNRSLDFEPMGRQGFRVLLMRVTPERTLFRALTVAFVALLALAAVALVWDAWRWRSRQLARAVREDHAPAPGRVPLQASPAVGDAILGGR